MIARGEAVADESALAGLAPVSVTDESDPVLAVPGPESEGQQSASGRERAG